jgi:hypothetical protein
MLHVKQWPNEPPGRKSLLFSDIFKLRETQVNNFTLQLLNNYKVYYL